jgi:DNA-binding transcriptional ArsR family regulator
LKRGLTEVCYGFFSTLANPTRLAILEKLTDGPQNVTALSESLGQEQSMVSHNLGPLERCGIVASTRQGKQKVYQLNGDTAERLFQVVKAHAEKFCPFHGACAESK